MARRGLRAGETYNRLTALEDAEHSREKILWRCTCGREKRIIVNSVRSGQTKSCGCLASEISREKLLKYGKGQQDGRRGHREHKLYRTWLGMRARTMSPTYKSYHRYGGRGIKVCERWQDPQVFYADIERLLGPRPAGHTIDRINVNGDYEPGNVRWATPLQQAWNKSTTPSRPQIEARIRSLKAEIARLEAGLELLVS
jgi:hypothetical protein